MFVTRTVCTEAPHSNKYIWEIHREPLISPLSYYAYVLKIHLFNYLINVDFYVKLSLSLAETTRTIKQNIHFVVTKDIHLEVHAENCKFMSHEENAS